MCASAHVCRAKFQVPRALSANNSNLAEGEYKAHLYEGSSFFFCEFNEYWYFLMLLKDQLIPGIERYVLYGRTEASSNSSQIYLTYPLEKWMFLLFHCTELNN